MCQYYLGVDLGGTNVRAASFKENRMSQIVKNKFILCQTAEDEFKNNIFNLLDAICLQNSGDEIAGIGMSIAALFDRNTGVITEWPNNPKWKNMNIEGLLEQRYKVPVVLEDDANSAALGEQLVGAAINQKSFIYTTISTGIGCGIVINDQLLTGSHGWAGELGHIKVIDNKDIKCRCGATGCLQALASGPAILSNYKHTNSYQNLENKDSIDVNDIAHFAYAQDGDAQKVFHEAGRYIGRALGNMVMLLDVPLIVLGGGVIHAGELILTAIDEGIKDVLSGRRECEIVCSQLQDRNGVYGAISKIDQFIHNHKTIKIERRE